MRVLHTVHGFAPDPGGGTERYVGRLARAQAARGQSIAVLSPSQETADPPDLLEDACDGIAVFRYRASVQRGLHWSEFHDSAADRLVRQLLSAWRPGVLHVHHWIGLTSRLVALAAEQAIPAVVTLHDSWGVCPRVFRLRGDLSFCQEPYAADLCPPCAPPVPWASEAVHGGLLAERFHHLAREVALARRLMVPSTAHRDLLARATGLPPERFEVLPHPALAVLRPAATPGRLTPSDRPLRIGCWGSLVPHKGQDILLRALPHLPAAPPWEVHLFGSPEDRRFEETLKGLAEGQPVTFHGRYAPRDLADASLDVAVFPSLAPESFSFTLDEALQLRLPMIVSDRGALAERAGAGALVVPAGDPEALAGALSEVLLDPERLPALRAVLPPPAAPDLDSHLERLEAIYAAATPPAAAPELDAMERLLALRHRQALEREGALDRAAESAERLRAELDRVRGDLTDLLLARERALAELRLDFDRLYGLYLRIVQSRGFKALAFLRELKGTIDPRGARDLAVRLRELGPGAVAGAATERVSELVRLARAIAEPPPAAEHAMTELEAEYEAWRERHDPAPDDLVAWGRLAGTLAHRPLVSVLMPVYEVPEPWLRQALASVRTQVYDRWELCVVDDASTKPHIRPVLDAAVRTDPRIRVVHLAARQGIVGASNTALGMASGDFVALLDHDDELAPHALYRVVLALDRNPALDLVYTDEDKVGETGRRFEPAFKPDWAPDLFRSLNYLGHLCVFRADLVRKLGGFRAGFDGSQDYDLLLRLTEVTDQIAHVPDVLYHWRTISGSAAGDLGAKPYAYTAAMRALDESLVRRGTPARVELIAPGRYRVRYDLRERPPVSIIIPMRDRWELTERCVRSIEARSSYTSYEILILDNRSEAPETRAFLERVARRHRVLPADIPFNYSRINNAGARHATGRYLLFLNNDTEVVSADWIEAMLEHAQRPEVAAVGGRLLYPDGRLQHAGVFVMGTPHAVAGHMFKFLPGKDPGYLGFAEVTGNRSAVTGACLMIRREVFDAAGGFDEAFTVAFGDVDLCLRLRERGYLNVYTPGATLYHHESATRGALHPPEDDALFRERWRRFFTGERDPYWNPNLSVDSEVFGFAVGH